jgi:lipopolysaccharide export LptBFGC system permease protein LptF
MWAGRAAALQNTLPAYVGAWLPNVVFLVVSVALLKAASTTYNAELAETDE